MKYIWLILVVLINYVRSETPDICIICKCGTIENAKIVNERNSQIKPRFQHEHFFQILENNTKPLDLSYNLAENHKNHDFIYINCSAEDTVGRKQQLQWPNMNDTTGIYGNFQNSKFKHFEQFPNETKPMFIGISFSENIIESMSGIEEFLNIQILNISFNQVNDIDTSISKLKKLKKLDLSNNRIRELTLNSFNNNELIYLNLSNNLLKKLDQIDFKNIQNLKVLDVSNNPTYILSENPFLYLNSLMYLFMRNIKITTIPILPPSLTSLNIRYNNIREIKELPKEMLYVDVSYNELEDISYLLRLPKLKMLNCSHNNLYYVPSIIAEKLELLNIAYNQLYSVPQFITPEYLPSLKAVILDGNPIENIKIEAISHKNLKYVSLSNMEFLEDIGTINNTGNAEIKKVNCTTERGIILKISNNPKLRTIERDTFRTFDVCELDLSGNSLYLLPNTLVNWNDLRKLNLQGNPWKCDCTSQWMLDTLLPKLYQNQPENLYNFKCALPSQLEGKLLAYWWNRSGGVFCGKKLYGAFISTDDMVVELGFNNVTIVIVGASICVMLLLVIAGLIWDTYIRKKRSRTNRRYV